MSIDASGTIRYHGRIDDTFAALGKLNQVVKSHDLADAIDAILQGKTIAQEQTEPIGCPFEAGDSKSQSTKITYTRNIAPIVNANCVTCHRAGQIAPFPLTSFTDVSKREDARRCHGDALHAALETCGEFRALRRRASSQRQRNRSDQVVV